ncbi:MAG: hypothetical protein ABFD92_08465 [Planctomycetaceae bacterium]|nr:hypothetical protein [Planctomycetaceae bacterium]
MKRAGRISAYAVLLLMIGSSVGCSGNNNMMTFKNGRLVKNDEVGEALEYHTSVPADLPRGGVFRDSAGLPDRLSDEDVWNGYSNSHRRGWTLCMKEIAKGASPQKDLQPPFAVPGYDYEVRGHTDGFRDCLTVVRAAIIRYGHTPVLAKVKATVANGKS